MDSQTAPSSLEAGMAALREGRAQDAVGMLADAAAATPGDVQLLMLLARRIEGEE